MILIKTLKNYKISVNFFSPWEKKIIFPNKMFRIYSESLTNNPPEQHGSFYSVQEASEKTGIPFEVIDKARHTTGTRYFSPKDKKAFWIYKLDLGAPIQLDNKDDFPNVNSIMMKFGLSRDDVIYQLCTEREKILQSQGNKISFYLNFYMGNLVEARQKTKKLLEETLVYLPPSHIQEKAKELLEEIEKLF